MYGHLEKKLPLVTQKSCREKVSSGFIFEDQVDCQSGKKMSRGEEEREKDSGERGLAKARHGDWKRCWAWEKAASSPPRALLGQCSVVYHSGDTYLLLHDQPDIDPRHTGTPLSEVLRKRSQSLG